MSLDKPVGSPRLGEYRRKRNFDASPEPEPEHGGLDGVADARFVVQEHHATRLHWDLRLEHGGALASWAIPNGIPDDPKHNRKAIQVEDHPLSYIDFEGTIPAGGYGAGEVSVWDRGTYRCEKWQSEEVIVVFEGERLRGRYVLFRAGQAKQDWMIHRMDPSSDPGAEEMPKLVEPMLARLSTLPADESEWAFEVKWDGVRAIAYSQPGRIRLLSRNGNEVTGAYPELRALNRALGSHTAILDGEVVAFDDAGRPSFAALQPRMHLRGMPHSVAWRRPDRSHIFCSTCCGLMGTVSWSFPTASVAPASMPWRSMGIVGACPRFTRAKEAHSSSQHTSKVWRGWWPSDSIRATHRAAGRVAG